MKRYWLAVTALLSVVTFGCSDKHYDFEADYNRVNDAYYGSSRLEAERELTDFLARAERNEASARRAHALDYDRVLGLAWLELWSVYDAAGNTDRAKTALTHAMDYFDKFSSDPRYISDKPKALIELLNQSETYQRPLWKRGANPKG